MGSMNRFLTNKNLIRAGVVLGVLVAAGLVFQVVKGFAPVSFDRAAEQVATALSIEEEVKAPVLDKEAYDAKMRFLAHAPVTTASTTVSSTPSRWPITDAPYPLPGALLPFNRILAFYGNFYSKGMGVLGEYPEDVVISKLQAEVARWEAADPETPVIPAIHYIASTAQSEPGKEGNYMLRMPDTQIDKAIELAKKVDGVVFIDLQVGLSDIQSELPLLDKYLAMPQVHLGIDPEFYMQNGRRPGEYMGSMDAADINWAADYLAKFVQQHDLPPKMLVIHRFTEGMVTNSASIKPLPEVQVVIEMDGWGEPAKKVNTYARVITAEPVQFTGFKLFYKNDLRAPSTRLMTPREVLDLTPSPSYIQYQ